MGRRVPGPLAAPAGPRKGRAVCVPGGRGGRESEPGTDKGVVPQNMGQEEVTP